MADPKVIAAASVLDDDAAEEMQMAEVNRQTVLRVVGNAVIVFLIVFGAVVSSLVVSSREQHLLFKVFAVIYFSLLPAWLYLQFISTKGKSLWDEYVLNLFRLQIDHYANLPMPPKTSIFYSKWQEARKAEEKSRGKIERGESIYEKKFEGLFGSVSSGKTSTFSVFRGENLFPVLVATLLISVGWVMVVELNSIFGLSFLPNHTDSGGSLHIPLETFRFAFLGAYFYVLQMLVRRYFQNDLKTSAYVNATMRFIVVMLLAWVVDLALQDQIAQSTRSALAFVIGVFPYIGWQALQSLLKLSIKLVVPSLEQKYPLNNLDGLNIWYESRLLEEGIEDMQNLATASLVDLMLNTRIPVERLVDWVDQSLLSLHLSNHQVEGEESDHDRLRRYGIRTATDLQNVLDSEDGNLVDQLQFILNRNQEEPSILRAILATLKNEPNLFHVLRWKSFAERNLLLIEN
ncbi:MAG: hypothetical protein Kow0042_07890 [Calditrichia bacterium]